MTRIVPTFWPKHLFKFSSNNGLSPGHSSLGSDGRCTCSSLPLTVWWVPYLNKGCRFDLSNGLGGDSNSGPVLAPGIYLSPTRIMAPPHATPILCQMKYTSVQVSYTWVSWWLPYLAKGPMPDDSHIGCILALQHLFKSNLNNSFYPSHSNLASDRVLTSLQVSFLWFSRRCHICPKAAGLASIMTHEVTQIVALFCPPAFI